MFKLFAFSTGPEHSIDKIIPNKEIVMTRPVSWRTRQMRNQFIYMEYLRDTLWYNLFEYFSDD